MYAEVTVIVDGALEDSETFFDYLVMQEFVDAIGEEARSHGYPTEVFVIDHDHEMTDDECGCVQYLQDHKPLFSWNV